MGIWDSKCVSDIIWIQDTKGYQDMYRKRDGKWLLGGMGIWDSKCVCGYNTAIQYRIIQVFRIFIR